MYSICLLCGRCVRVPSIERKAYAMLRVNRAKQFAARNVLVLVAARVEHVLAVQFRLESVRSQ